MDDLTYSINVLRHGFMTWCKHQVRFMVYPKSIRRNLVEPQSMYPSPNDIVRKIGKHVIESQNVIHKVYRWGQDEVDENRGYVWREWMILYFCRSAYIYRPLRSQVLLCYNKVREVGHCFSIAKTTLSSYIEQDRIATEEEFTRLAVQLVKAVAYLHDRGIIHGDIKPDNILMTAQHDIQLADLGSVRLEGLPQYGMNSGTTAFQSPKRLKDGKCSKNDDVWALGVTFWWMKYRRWMVSGLEDTLIDYQFFWAKFQKGLIPHDAFELSLLCWREGSSIEDVMNFLGVEKVTRIPKLPVPKQGITMDELGPEGNEWMLLWAHSVQQGLHDRGASYNRLELIQYIKTCFHYVWLQPSDRAATMLQPLDGAATMLQPSDVKNKIDPSVLYHMIHISDVFFSS